MSVVSLFGDAPKPPSPPSSPPLDRLSLSSPVPSPLPAVSSPLPIRPSPASPVPSSASPNGTFPILNSTSSSPSSPSSSPSSSSSPAASTQIPPSVPGSSSPVLITPTVAPTGSPMAASSSPLTMAPLPSPVPSSSPQRMPPPPPSPSSLPVGASTSSALVPSSTAFYSPKPLLSSQRIPSPSHPSSSSSIDTIPLPLSNSPCSGMEKDQSSKEKQQGTSLAGEMRVRSRQLQQFVQPVMCAQEDVLYLLHLLLPLMRAWLAFEDALAWRRPWASCLWLLALSYVWCSDFLLPSLLLLSVAYSLFRLTMRLLAVAKTRDYTSITESRAEGGGGEGDGLPASSTSREREEEIARFFNRELFGRPLLKRRSFHDGSFLALVCRWLRAFTVALSSLAEVADWGSSLRSTFALLFSLFVLALLLSAAHLKWVARQLPFAALLLHFASPFLPPSLRLRSLLPRLAILFDTLSLRSLSSSSSSLLSSSSSSSPLLSAVASLSSAHHGNEDEETRRPVSFSLSSNALLKSGWLKRRKRKHGRWKRRFCRLTEQTFSIYRDEASPAPLYAFSNADISIGMSNIIRRVPFSFALFFPPTLKSYSRKRLTLAADSLLEKNFWLSAFGSLPSDSTNTSTSLSSAPTSSSTMSSTMSSLISPSSPSFSSSPSSSSSSPSPLERHGPIDHRDSSTVHVSQMIPKPAAGLQLDDAPSLSLGDLTDFPPPSSSPESSSRRFTRRQQPPPRTMPPSESFFSSPPPPDADRKPLPAAPLMEPCSDSSEPFLKRATSPSVPTFVRPQRPPPPPPAVSLPPLDSPIRQSPQNEPASESRHTSPHLS